MFFLKHFSCNFKFQRISIDIKYSILNRPSQFGMHMHWSEWPPVASGPVGPFPPPAAGVCAWPQLTTHAGSSECPPAVLCARYAAGGARREVRRVRRRRVRTVGRGERY